MDLTIGPRYEAFRAELRAFLAVHAASAPRVLELRVPSTLAWQRLLIEHG